MKFITYNDKFEIQMIHNMPFDSINGLGKTEEELLKIGALVKEIPNVDVPNDKFVIYKYNQKDNTVYYELIDRQLTTEEQNTNDIKGIKQINDEQDNLINISMCATDEIFMMIEPLLETLPQDSVRKAVSKMVDLYVAMIQRGIKTIDEVPVRYRQQVKDILEKLEK